MVLKKIGSRVFITNLFADFVLSKIPNEEQSIINVVDCKNFYIIKGQTTSKEILDLVTLTTEFSQKFESLIGNTKMSHTIDLIDYNYKLSTVSEITHTYHFSENCSYSESQINFLNQENESYDLDFICKKITDEELVNTSEFPHGYSLGQGRLLYYYGKHLFYSIPQTYPYAPLTFKLTTLKDDDGDNLISIYNSNLNTDDERLRSALLDVFDFDMSWLEKEIKKVDWSIELTNPLEEYSFIKKRNKDLILF
jgi:hypothetical protein